MVRVNIRPLRAPSRSNPSRGVGAVVVNPKRKRSKSRRGKSGAFKSLSRLLRMNRGRKGRRVRANRHRGARRSARRSSFRLNRGMRRLNRSRRGRKASRRGARKAYRMNRGKARVSRARAPKVFVKLNRGRKGRRRANPVIVNRRRANPVIVNRRRRSMRRNYRRNSGMPKMLAPLGKLPLIGPFFGGALGSLLPAGLGAVSVYPTVMVVGKLENYFPTLRADFAFALGGFTLAGILGALDYYVLKGKVPYVRDAQVALATAGAAVGAYKRITGAGGQTVSEEKAGMWAGELAGDWAGAEALGWPGETRFIPMSQKAFGVSRADIDAVQAQYADAHWNDAHAMGDDCALSAVEAQAALSGPGAWRATFAPARGTVGMLQRMRPGGMQVSPHAGKPGHRFGWLIDAIGFTEFQKFAALSPQVQREVLPRMLTQFQKAAGQVLDEHEAEAGMSGWGTTQIFAA